MAISGCMSTRARLLCSAAVLSLSAGAAAAQNASVQSDRSASNEQIETVVVSGSRISRPGFETPTPVTAVTADDLEKTAPIELADALNQLPQFGAPPASATSSFQGETGAGANNINLRNLGANRTLVLLNGERVVYTALTGTVDLNTLPTTLLKRVDVVTGGASAAWGSDAVAGVVNLILDTNFVGVKANLMGGVSSSDDYPTGKVEGAFGTDLLGGKGHIEASASYFNSPQLVVAGDRHWFEEPNLMPNPNYAPGNGQPQLLHQIHVGLSQATQGGLITAGPLQNIQFIGTGTPVPYNPGRVSGVLSYGGNGDETLADKYTLANPERGLNLFTYASYDLSSNLRLHVDADYGHDAGQVTAVPSIHFANITILSGNAFLPPSIQSQMTAQGIPSFQFGSTMGNLGINTFHDNRVMERVSVGLDGSFGDGWTWNAYYQHGETHYIERITGDIYSPNLALATDSVISPTTGAATCRSTITNPTNGCVPLNLFGVGVATPQAIGYVEPMPWNLIKNYQDVFSGSVQGEPISDWAGPISIALGGEYREESASGTADALSYTRSFFDGNFQPFGGSLNVKEGFVETVVPLAENTEWAKSLEFNAAGRVTDYSASGTVETWKLGLNWQINDDYRLRTTWSSDIRAPNLTELFTKATSGTSIITDPFRGNASSAVLGTTRGNPNLVPEAADTISGGVVLTPTWLPGFTASFDWYSIVIKKAITTLTAVNTLQDCFNGQTALCQYITRDATGAITEINLYPLNTAQSTTSGLDVEMDYQTDFLDGTLKARALGNYTDETTSTQNGVVVDNANSLGFDTSGKPGVPKFKATVSTTYDQGPFSFTVQSRVWGQAKLVNNWTSLNVDDNQLPIVAYLDLRGSYTFDASQMQFYYAIDNTFDTPPPAVPRSSAATNPQASLPTRADVYDVLGRYYRAGIRINL